MAHRRNGEALNIEARFIAVGRCRSADGRQRAMFGDVWGVRTGGEYCWARFPAGRG
jgi:hypothetical protein